MSTMRSRITIDAPPERVWMFVADPVMESAWNPKIVAIDRDAEGPVRTGERFEMEFVMSGTGSRCEAEALEASPPGLLVYRYRMLDERLEGSVDIRYTLEPKGDGTRLVQSIDMRGMGISWPVRALIWFVTRFGTPVGKPYLEELKGQVEAIENA